MTKKTIVLSGFVLAKFILQYFLVSPEYELHRDEFLHLDQANHLAWGYLSVPPVTSWISAIIGFLGNSIFWVRFFPALFGALTLVVVWKAIETLKGNLFALVLGATCILFSALLRLNMFHQPTSLDTLCWTALLFILTRYADSGNPQWLYTGAAILAIGFLNKYNIAFLAAALFPALLLSKPSIFTGKHFYFSVALFLLLILPNLVWQYNNGFPVYHHMKLLAKTQLVNVNSLDFLKDQLLFFTGGLFVIATSLYALLFYAPFKKYRFFLYTCCFTLIIFLLLKAKGYYAIGLYPIYIAFGAVYLQTILNTGWKRYLQPLAIAIPVLFFIPMYQLMFPNKSPQYIMSHPGNYKKLGLLRWEDGKDHELPQDYADMLGWKELAGIVDSVYNVLPAARQTLILCDNYGQAGAINYYTKNKNIIANSFNADYINWFNLNIKYVNLIRVKELQSKHNELKETGPFFHRSYTAGAITNTLAREAGTAVFVFENAKVDINQRIQEEIKKAKKFFQSDTSVIDNK